MAMGVLPMLEPYVRSSQALDKALPFPTSFPKSLPSLADHGEVVLTKVKIMWMPCIGPPQTSITADAVVSRVPSQMSSTSHLRFLAPSFQALVVGFGECDMQDVRPVAPVVREVAEVHVVGPIQGIAATTGRRITEVGLPRIVVPPVEHRHVALRDQGVAKALGVRIHVAKLVLTTCIAVEIIDPLDTDGDHR